MKVKELIAELQKIKNQEAEVILAHTEYFSPDDSMGYDVENDWFDVHEENTHRVVLR